ncbi:MAG: ABC transporter ATP-binding protein [Ancrocorticia sp.]|jgi:ABC-type multidrug transport system, ATPase component|nr:ABC transporter ATP-binding protein [Ancrocorticia sp.]MCI2178073.1 ABC transporter ATP-binding protein [Ancrocorticia sp.]MCI2193880.1 ABC transporter ATP-binding protein [Ancrocorticia sp.]MCI2199417.1 ABC transporter ATP-binding protein [Ancrocorticia sp.]
MIQVEHLTKRYGSVTAVDDLSFTVHPGQVTGFLGPNGSGKSTTMRCIVGLDRPNSGRALIDGTRYRQLASPLTTVGALLDGKAFHPSRTARSQLQIIADSHGIPSRRVTDVLELTGLTDVADKKLKGYSLGMGQRLGVAIALIGDPNVLLFDEPVNGLDPDGVRWIRTLMRGLASEGRTVLVSSHLMSEMALTADQLIVIGRGRLIASGPIREFTENAAHTTVRVAGPDIGAVVDTLKKASIPFTQHPATTEFPHGMCEVPGGDQAEIGHLLFHNGVEISELSATHSTLEDVFMELTAGATDFGFQNSAPGLPPMQAPGFPPMQAPGFPPMQAPEFGGQR